MRQRAAQNRAHQVVETFLLLCSPTLIRSNAHAQLTAN
jgi:hypothetical protein